MYYKCYFPDTEIKNLVRVIHKTIVSAMNHRKKCKPTAKR